MRAVLAFVLAVIGLTTSAAIAQEGSGRVVVVELYTSQGCSSCPPADKLLGKLAERDDVIPLALHVDYWDYIGWKDEFADPAHTQRQRGYARAWNQRTIYTPQMVVGGLHGVVGNRPMDVATLIQKHAMATPRADVTLSRAGEAVTIEAQALGEIAPAQVHLVRYTPSAQVDIRRGENAGRKLTYHNIVTEWRTLGAWDGAAPLRLTETVKGDGPVVVIVQEGTHGLILAAARLR